MTLRHPVLVVAAAAVTVGAVLAAIVASPDGSLWKMLLVALALGLPGALSATEHPRNPVGWLLLAVACLLSAMGLAAQARWSGTAGAWADWLVDRAGAVVVPLMFLALVLLPDGHLPSRRWRPAVVAAVAVQVALVVAWSLVAGGGNPAGVLPAAWSDGLDAAGDWLLQVPLLLAAAAVVVRLRRPDDRAGLQWALGGALGFTLLAVVGHALLPAAADALDVLGALVLGAGLTAMLMRRPTPEPAPAPPAREPYDDQRLATLSTREREVLDLVAEGLTNRQIADRLFISPVTARNHVSRILTKLDLENRTQAAAWLARGPVDRQHPPA